MICSSFVHCTINRVNYPLSALTQRIGHPVRRTPDPSDIRKMSAGAANWLN